MSRDFNVEIFGKHHHISAREVDCSSLLFLVNDLLNTLRSRDYVAAHLALFNITDRRTKQPLEPGMPFMNIPTNINLTFFSKSATKILTVMDLIARVMDYVPATAYMGTIYSVMRTCRGAYSNLIHDRFWTDDLIRFRNPFIGPLDDDWAAYRVAYGLPLMNLHRIRHIFNSTSRIKLYYGCLGEGAREAIAIVTTSSVGAILKLVNDQILPRSAKQPPCLAAYEPLSAEGALTKIESGGVCVETVAANADVHLRRVGDSRLSFYFWQHDSESAQLLQVHCRSLYRRLSALVLVVAYDEPNLSRLLNELFSAYFAEWRSECFRSSSLQATSKVFSSLPVLVLVEVPSTCSGTELMRIRSTVTDIVRPLAGRQPFKVQPLCRGAATPDKGAAAGFNFLARVLGRNAFL